MDRYGELQVFARVVDEGNFSAAARSLSLTPSAVSKLVARVEDRVGATLFRRDGRSVALTAEGRAFHAAALRAIEAMEAAETALLADHVASDTLRVRSMPSFAVSQLAAVVPEFCRLHPALKLELLLSMDPGNLLEGGVDVAIFVGPLADSALVAHRFAAMRWIICAAPGYLARRPAPRRPADLVHHECLGFLPDIPARAWTARDRGGAPRRLRLNARITVNQAQILLELARQGAGVVQLAEFQVADDLRAGRLVELFPESQDPTPDPISAVYATKRHLSPRIRVFLDFLDRAFAGREAGWG